MHFIKKINRRILHLYRSGCFVIGTEHFLVMFPSAMLIAKLAGSTSESIVELTSILFMCGCGTILFLLLTKGKLPFFLGPSFSYIGFLSYQVSRVTETSDIIKVRSIVFYGYIIAGVFLLIFGFLYQEEKAKAFINMLFPSTVMGPAISLIGLELADMAAEDAGFTEGTWTAKVLSVITMSCIVLFSLARHHFLQNASILIGVLIGCIAATFMGVASWQMSGGINIHIPKLYFSCLLTPPKELLSLSLSVLPCTVIAFIESLGRVSVYTGMLKRDKKEYDKKLPSNAISMHAADNLITSAIGMMPNAIYAENLAIMNLHAADLSTRSAALEDEDPFVEKCYHSYSVYPYVIASIISIIVACFGGLQNLFISIPKPILGGMEMFVFALIAAPGIQMLVEQQVNYKRISNQIITASVLLAGISNVSISYGTFTLKGMSLGLTIGVAVNVVTIVLDYFGFLNERFTAFRCLVWVAPSALLTQQPGCGSIWQTL